MFGGARFTVINVLPGALLMLVILSTYRTHLYDAHRGVDLSVALPTGWQALQIGFAAVLIGILVQPFQIPIVRLLEGYGWEQRLPSLLAGMAVERQHRRLARAQLLDQATVEVFRGNSMAEAARYAKTQARLARAASVAGERLVQYPADSDRILPTMLGNILRAGEDPAGGRYGFQSMTVYPRMYPYISGKLDKAITRQLDLIDTTSALCLSFMAAAVATLPIIVIRHSWWSFVPAAFLGLAWLSYRAALNSATDHGALFATAFDLHRFDLIKNLHYPLPETVEDEWAFNQALSAFLQGPEQLFCPPEDIDVLQATKDLDVLRATRYQHQTQSGNDSVIAPTESQSSG